jgi:RHS repeat-associated protein
VITGLPTDFVPNPQTQRKRITHVTYEYQYDGDDQTYDHATHYDYDIHGNVKTLLQDNQKMAQDPLLVDQQFKRMDYNYDLISGNVHRVSYEKGKIDQWHHAYEYDADNRITEVFTSTTTPLTTPEHGQIASQNEPGMTPFWDKEASYEYYAHGPLARTELGQEKVQGLDYVYTVQGWMKGVNSNSLNETYDPGKDGDGNILARDAFGFSLHYFEGDYGSIAGTNDFLADQTGSDLIANSSDLYNGNIGRMVTTITEPTTREILPLGNAYRYDQLNRLSESRSFDNLNLSTNTWGYSGTYDDKYFNQFEYDANGNIIFQRRHNKAGATIDKLTYDYKRNPLGKLVQNRLYHVNDGTNSSDFADDIDDMGSFDPTIATINDVNNYSYDQEGRLIYDKQEDIENIEWRVDGKVLKITRPIGSSKKNIIFEYDAMGHRVGKHVLTSSDVLEKSTYYILDASGNTMSVYERAINETEESVDYYLAENHIYGSSRLGVLDRHVSMLGLTTYDANSTVITHHIGKRNYELSNHLGNVLSVISDKPIPHDNAGTIDYYMADIREAHDYSPFGVLLNERTSTVLGSERFRFGFQNQEMDDEVKGAGNSVNYKYRMHDPRLGRFFAVDPLVKDYSELTPYQFSSNSPIFMIELEGMEGKIFMYKVWYNDDGRHKASLGSITVEGLKSDLNKRIYMPYDQPNAKPLHVDYMDSKGQSTGMFDMNNKPTVAELNETFGNQLPVKHEKSFMQELNDAAPWWAKDYGMEGGAEAGNVDESRDGSEGMRMAAADLDNVGTILSYTKVGAPIGAAFGIMSDLLETGADIAEDNPKAIPNLGVRVVNTIFSSVVGKKVDLLPVQDFNKQVIKGALNQGTGIVENELTK